LKIVIPVHYFPPRYLGGTEQYTLRLAQALRARGHGVTVVSAECLDRDDGPPVLDSPDHYQGVPVHRLSLRDREHRVFANAFDNPTVGAWFDSFLTEPPDLVHFQDCYRLSSAPVAAARCRGVPVVVTLHSYWFFCPRSTLVRTDGSLCTMPEAPGECSACCLRPDVLGAESDEDSMVADPDGVVREMPRRREVLLDRLRAADAVIAPSAFLRDLAVRCGAPADRIAVIRLGVGSVERSPPRVRTGRLRVTFTGHLLPHKGALILLKAVTRMCDVGDKLDVRVYGSPLVHPDYARRVIALGEKLSFVRFPGEYPGEQLPSILDSSDVVVVPSLWYENSPLAVLQALARGVPVLASRVGALGELVQDGVNGLLFRMDDPDDLERKLRQLLDNPELLSRLSAEARYDWTSDQEIDQLEALYDRVVARHRCGVAGGDHTS
jgi:glycosyltransferase involved in cell wall biosynthesis